ncbi:MAG TPA: cupin domain-containing protein [Chitinophaga sp.]|uniref:cupin domain-containing protein n=1 Tax=Chitinophaga sp. TaxID=1869181 RepID=UPI002BD5F004|nr:cupin domain-containing protein [Chitinophaga sp.]HVI48313.1 cupin domain-containing protein [Chitinophaga sp.]
MTKPEALSNMPAKNTIPGFYGRFVHGEQSTLAFWEITAGSVSPQHQHPHEQITYIAEGIFEMEMNGTKYMMQQHDVLVIPPNVPHGGRAVEDCKIIDSFSPPRDDYR